MPPVSLAIPGSMLTQRGTAAHLHRYDAWAERRDPSKSSIPQSLRQRREDGGNLPSALYYVQNGRHFLPNLTIREDLRRTDTFR